MATTPAPQPVSIREYLKFKAPAGFRDELIYGEIIVSPEPKVLHFQVADNIYKLLSAAVSAKFRVAQRINLRFEKVKSMPSPDVFVLSMEAYDDALLSNKYPEGKATILAIEVISPSNRKKVIDRKLDIFRGFDIEAWVISPKREDVKVYRGAETLTYKVPESIILPAELGGKPIRVADIFQLTPLKFRREQL